MSIWTWLGLLELIIRQGGIELIINIIPCILLFLSFFLLVFIVRLAVFLFWRRFFWRKLLFTFIKVISSGGWFALIFERLQLHQQFFLVWSLIFARCFALSVRISALSLWSLNIFPSWVVLFEIVYVVLHFLPYFGIKVVLFHVIFPIHLLINSLLLQLHRSAIIKLLLDPTFTTKQFLFGIRLNFSFSSSLCRLSLILLFTALVYQIFTWNFNFIKLLNRKPDGINVVLVKVKLKQSDSDDSGI